MPTHYPVFKLSPPPHRVKEPVTDVKTFLKTLHRKELEFVITFATKRSKGESVNFGFLKKASARGEDVYIALGQSDAGRYLTVLFIYKKTREALILSAREMAAKERKQYDKK